MSTVISSERRLWVPLLITLVLITALMVVVLNLPTGTSGLSLISPPKPAIKQARWEIRTFPAASGKLTPKKEKLLESQEPPVKSLIQDVYDAAFIGGSSLANVVNKSFLAPAGNALLDAKIGFPSGATEVKTLKREARVGIDIPTGARAAATVKIVARALMGDRTVKLSHRSILWLEKEDGRWRVIAFDVMQEPAK